MPATATPSTLFVNVVWGEEYVRSYLDLTLATELFPGNLPAFVAAGSSRYRIYTDEPTRHLIEKHEGYSRLRAVLPVEIVLLEHVLPAGRSLAIHERQRACHSHALSDVSNHAGAVAFLGPDAVWSDGSFAALERHIRTGKRVVMLFGGMRVEKDRFYPAFFKKFGPSPDLRPVTADALIALALDNLHPDLAAARWDGAVRPSWPSFLTWGEAAGAGLLVRGFHFHPLWVWPARPDILPETTIDGSYIEAACPDAATWHIVTDPREVCVFEYSLRSQQRLELQHRPKNPAWLGCWIHKHGDRLHRQLIRLPTRYARDSAWPGWAAIERESAELVERAVQLSEGRASPWRLDYWRYRWMLFYDWQKSALRPLRELSRRLRGKNKR